MKLSSQRDSNAGLVELKSNALPHEPLNLIFNILGSRFELVKRMTTDDVDFDKFRRFQARSGPHYTDEICNDSCRRDMLCSLVRSRMSDSRMCEEMRQQVDSRSTKLESDYSWWWRYLWSKTTDEPSTGN